VVWDQADFPSTLLDPDATLFDFDRDVMHFEPRSAQRRFFRYLSLWSKDEYTRGISVYISGHGIVGLEVHFTSFSRLSGTRKGCTLHLSFCPDERIAHVWLRVLNTPSSAFATPALVVSIWYLLHLLLLICHARLKQHVEDCTPLDRTFDHLW